VWDLKTGECLKTLRGHNAHVYAVIVGRRNRIISSSSDCKIKVWEYETGQVVSTCGGFDPYEPLWTNKAPYVDSD
jgi:WD40 repeat protein